MIKKNSDRRRFLTGPLLIIFIFSLFLFAVSVVSVSAAGSGGSGQASASASGADSSLPAAAVSPAPFLDLMQAYKLALRHDPGFKAALYGKKASEDLGWEGLAFLLPRLNFSANLSRYDFVNPPPYYLSYDARMEQIDLTQPVISIKRLFEYHQYKTRASIGGAKFKSQKERLVMKVAEAYLDVLASQDYLKALKSQKRAVRRELKQAKKLYAAGAGTVTDVYDARAKYYSVLSHIVGAKSGLETNYMKFKGIVGASGRNLAPLRRRIPLSPPRPLSAGYWIKVAANRNPDLEYYRYEEDYYKEDARKSISSHFPSLDFTAGYSATNTQQYIQTPPLRYYNIGFQLNIPIFNGGYNYAKTSESENLARQAAQVYRKELYKNSREIKQSILDIKGSIIKIKMLELSLKSARISLKGNELGFQSGVKTSTDVLNAVEALYGARVKLLKAKYEYIISLLNLRLNAGVLSEYDLRGINKWLK